jgi:hypothetical protein
MTKPIVRGEGQSKLALCDCGQLHFTYGPLTLHFDREEFLRFTESVARLGALVRHTPRPISAVTHPASDTDLCH